MQNILITGGAGFIGAHLARELLEAGYHVRVLDNLTPQVHPSGERPAYLDDDGEPLEPVATPEEKSASLISIYALNKYAQERMALIFGAACGREAVAMRFFNAYGPHQALSNPYTGVLAIFAARLQGWAATARFRACARCGARLPA